MAKDARPMAVQNWSQDIPGDSSQEQVEPAKVAERVAVGMTMRKRKHKALLPQESNSKGTAESEPEMAEDMMIVEGVDKMPTTLRRGDRVNSVAGTGGLEHLVPW